MASSTIKKSNICVVLFLIASVFCFSQQQNGRVQYGLFYNYMATNSKIDIMQSTITDKLPIGRFTNTHNGSSYGFFVTAPIKTLAGKYTALGLRVAFSEHYVDVLGSDIKSKNIFEQIFFTPFIQHNFYDNFIGRLGLQLALPTAAQSMSYNDNSRPNRLPINSINTHIFLSVGYPLYIPSLVVGYFVPEVNCAFGVGNEMDNTFKGRWLSDFFSLGCSFVFDRGFANHIDTIYYYSKNVHTDTLIRVGMSDSDYVKMGESVFGDSSIKKIDTSIFQVTYNYRRVDTSFIKGSGVFNLTATTLHKDTNGVNKEIDNNFRMDIHEYFLYQEWQPLLNVIFFDKNSSEIASKYNQFSTSNDLQGVKDRFGYNDAMEAYYNILNIVGLRMQNNLSYILRLEGCNDDYTAGEKDNLDLSYARAESIKKYLTNVWQIDDERISVVARKLPHNPSIPISEQYKQQENRRVEMIPNDYTLFEPIIIGDKHIDYGGYTSVRFDSKITSVYQIKKYTLITKINNEVVKFITEHSPDMPDGVLQLKYDFPLDFIPKSPESVYSLLLIVEDIKGRKKTYEQYFPIYFHYTSPERDTRTKIYKFFLLNNFRNSDLLTENAGVIRSMLENIDDTRNIYITGFTDITGRESTNAVLGLQRAERVRDLLEVPNATVDAANRDNFMYDNTTPEGRFYCRSVEVVIDRTFN